MQVGPNLTGLADRAGTRAPGLDARAYVRESIREPGAVRVPDYTAVMPDLGLSDDEIDSLTAFLLASLP
jgi:cytochrome c oxidase subunit 2